MREGCKGRNFRVEKTGQHYFAQVRRSNISSNIMSPVSPEENTRQI
jgi:hypothetical protein